MGHPYNPLAQMNSTALRSAANATETLARQIVYKYRGALAHSDFGTGLIELGLEARFINTIAQSVGSGAYERSLSFDFFRNNIARAAEGAAVPGSSLTCVYDTMRRTQTEMNKTLITGSAKIRGKNARLLRKLNEVNFADPKSVLKHHELVMRYASNVLVRNKTLDNFRGYRATDVYDADQEIAILLALRNSSALGTQAVNYSEMMNDYLQRQISGFAPIVQGVLTRNPRFGVNPDVRTLRKLLEAYDEGRKAIPRVTTLYAELRASGAVAWGGRDFSTLTDSELNRLIEHDLATYTDEQRMKIKELQFRREQVGAIPAMTLAEAVAVRNMYLIYVEKARFADKYLLGRIASGQIDVDAVIKAGMFCGAVLTEEMKDVLLTMKALALTGVINTDAHNDLMIAIGGSKSAYKSIDLTKTHATAWMKKNGVCGVNERIREFEQALSKGGIATPDGASFKNISVKKLTAIIKSPNFVSYSPEAQNAIKELLKLKNRMEGIRVNTRMLNSLKAQLVFKLRAGIKNTDLDAGIRQTRRMSRIAKLAYSTALRTGRLTFRISKFLYKHSPAKFQAAMASAAKKIQSAITSIQAALAAAAAPVKAAVSAAVSKVGAAVSKLGKKMASAASAAAPRTTALLGRIAPRIKNAVKKSISTIIAKRAQKKTLAAAGAKFGLLRFYKFLAEIASKIMLAMIKVIAIVLVVSIAITSIGVLLVAVCDTVTKLDETLFGWFDGDLWPFDDATEEEKQNILYATLLTLQEEEQYITNLKNLVDAEGKGSYYSFADPQNEFKRKIYPIGETGITEGTALYYFYETPEGTFEKIPISQYSNTKYAIGAAHAVTCQIEDKNDLEIFTKYALGAWHNMNKVETDIFVDICDGDCVYKYNCNGTKDSIYKHTVVEYSAGDEITAQKVNSTSQYIDGETVIFVDSKLVPYNSQGCRVTYYSANGTFSTYDKNNEFAVTSKGSKGALSTFRIYLPTSSAIYAASSAVNSANPYARLIPSTGSYYLVNPAMNSMCADEMRNLDSKSNAAIREFLTSKVGYHGESQMAACTNSRTVTCSGCVSTVHYHEGLTAPCSCAGCVTTNRYYCQGHIATEYCSTATVIDENYEKQEHIIKVACSHCKQVITRTGQVRYSCLGHEVTEYCTEEKGVPMTTACMNCTVETTYTCPGYTVTSCPGHKVCLGHYHCQGHHSCPGHEADCCTGHVRYVVTEYISNLVKSPEALFGYWEYETHIKKWIFPKTDKFTSDELQKDTEFTGWTDDTKSAAYGIADQDWYQLYGISSSEFQGGQCSPSEIKMIKERYNISSSTINESRMRIIDCALDCIGKIPYYPGGQAYGATYTTSFGLVTEPRIGSDGTVYANYGLEGKYFADWVYWSSNFNPDDETPVYRRNDALKKLDINRIVKTKATNENLMPGDILIYVGASNKILDSCIFLGYENNSSLTSGSVVARVVRMGTDWSKLALLGLNGSSWYKCEGLSD